jgi:hypothetical protein
MTKYLSIFLLIILFTSCEKSVDIKLGNDFTNPSLVLNGYLENDSIVRIHLSSSASSFTKNKIANITNAYVELFEDGNKVENFVHQSNGYYTSPSNFKPKINKRYEVKVSKSGFEDINAATSMLSEPAVTNITFDTLTKAVNFQLTDPAGKNYYIIDIVVKDKLTDSVLYSNLRTSDKALLGNNNDGIDLEGANDGESQLPTMITDELFDGKTTTYKLIVSQPFNYAQNSAYFKFYYMKDVDMYLYFRAISPDLYDYFISSRLNLQNNGDPFSEPVQVLSNVKNGFGVLGAKTNKVFKIN